MKKSIVHIIICFCLFTLGGCLHHGLDNDNDDFTAESIREEVEFIIDEEDIDKLWALNVDRCATVASFSGTEDFEFLEFFIRIQDQYYQYESLVSFEVNDDQMLLCFN